MSTENQHQMTEEDMEILKEINMQRKPQCSNSSAKSKKVDKLTSEKWNNEFNIIDVLRTDPHQILRIIAKALSLNKRITTSKCKLDMDLSFCRPMKKGETFEIIGLDLTVVRNYFLVEKTEYKKVMNDKSSEKRQKLYKQIKNGCDGLTRDEKFNDSHAILVYIDLDEAFDYITIEENDKQNESEMKCEEIEYQNEHNEKKGEICLICATQIEDDDEYIEKYGKYFHKSCFKYACCSSRCSSCYSKHDLRLKPWGTFGLICAECYERNKNRNRKRLLCNELYKYNPKK